MAGRPTAQQKRGFLEDAAYHAAMLHSLHIRNLALVDELRIEFAPGLNAITGETGAGKSLIVGALTLLLGERADKSVVREGAEHCLVEGVFHLADTAAVDALLRDSGLEACADGQVIVRRAIAAAGAGRQFINDRPVTVQALKALGACLVDMHGPHDHQSLLHADFQRELLDAYGVPDDARTAYATAYAAWRALEEQSRALAAEGGDAPQQLDFLSFQVKELEEAALRADEEEALLREHTLLGHAQRVLQLADGVRAALTEGETAAFGGLAAAQQALGELRELAEPAAAWKEEARALAAQVQELSAAVARFALAIEGDPGRLQWLDERLATYHKMKHKYGPTTADVLRRQAETQARLQRFQTRGEHLARLERESAAARRTVEQRGLTLRAKRQTASARLARAIGRELRALGLADAAFFVRLRETEPSVSGLDAVEFGFAPNPGEAEQPLRAIASSGEISRVMLAAKTALARHDRVPVLVFDEIDVNLGGAAGQAVGRKLAAVAEAHQVLCITHLPQVAACAAAQFAVAKAVRDGRTITRMLRLDKQERVEEIARMLGGRDLTSVTLRHARELLASSAR